MNRSKTITTILTIATLSLAVFGCDTYSERWEEGDFTCVANSEKIYISSYNWDGETMEITIPNEINGKPVTALGGDSDYFYINNSKLEEYPYYTPPAEYTNIKDKILSCDEIVYYDITLNLGSNLKSLNFSGTPFAYELHVVDGKNVAYVYRFYVNCDEANVYHFSKDGIIYDSVSEQPIKKFCYWNESFD